jgi:tetratricopeptide (TPR) repeat protein
MFHLIRGFGSIILLVLLASCASTEKHSITEDVISDTGNYKYAAWRPDNTGQFEAINVLLDEADMLIESRAYNSAVDKIERALRIKPEYAPAWSRLSWLALQMDSPERSIQMAKRSNSLAFSDPELQVLNWSFIRTASEVLNDEDSYQRANRKIESLKAFY